jgi:hypothetical protein
MKNLVAGVTRKCSMWLVPRELVALGGVIVDRAMKELLETPMTVQGSADANTIDARRTKRRDKNFLINSL